MKTLLLSSMALAAGPALAHAARQRNWAVTTLQQSPPVAPKDLVFYGSTLDALAVARRFGLALLEPPLDLLARLPAPLLLRQVECGQWRQLRRLPRPMFIKPADPLDKTFDAGVYRELEQIRTPRPLPPATPILVAEPVEWLAEYRCFILDRKLATASPYLSFGRPLHQQAGGVSAAAIPAPVAAVCDRLFALPELPPAFVVDVGLIEDRGWAVVEFNPCWCSGLLSADPKRVLDVLARSCHPRGRVNAEDRRWILRRPAGS